jgi:DNA-binding MarR family transcriptional regulator
MKRLPLATYFERHTEPLERRIASGLAKVGLALKYQAGQGAGGRGLSPTQGQILATLSMAGPLRPSDVADRLAVTLPTISESVRVLVEKGLLEKQRDPRDARATLLQLTAEGRHEASIAAGWPDFLASAAGELEGAEREAFFKGLVKMIRTLQERGQIPLSGMCVSCRYFRPNVHDDAEAPHHCALVDSPFGARHLRLECPEHERADDAPREAAWRRFCSPSPPAEPEPAGPNAAGDENLSINRSNRRRERIDRA